MWSAWVAVAALAAPPVPAPDGALLALAEPEAITDGAAQLRAAIDALPEHGWRVWRGSLALEGHLATPGEIRELPVELRIRYDDAGLAISLGIVWGDAPAWAHAGLVDGRIFEHGDAGWRPAEAPLELWRDLLQLHPAGLLQPLSGAPRRLAPGALGPDPVERLDLDDPEQGRWVLALDPSEDRLLGAVRIWADGRLGDVADTLRWGVGTDGLPETIEATRGGPDPLGMSLSAEGPSEAPPGWQPLPRAEPTQLQIIGLADGVFALEVPDADARVLVLQRADHLVLIEAPLTSALGERILATIRERWPDRPVREVFVGHHHPHYTGALRALAAAGATIRCTGAQRPAIERVLATRHALVPDAWAGHDAPAQIETFEGRTVSRGRGGPRLVALDIGARSQHTDSYVVFWLPESGLLFQGDLGYFTGPDGLVASGRAAGLLGALADARIEPDAFVQSWPLSVPLRVDHDELRALIEQR